MREVYVCYISHLAKIAYVCVCVVYKIKFYFSKLTEFFVLESHWMLAEERAFAIPLRFCLYCYLWRWDLAGCCPGMPSRSCLIYIH